MLLLALIATIFRGAFFAWDVMHVIIRNHLMAVLNLRLYNSIAMVTGKATLHAKYLRTRHDQYGQHGEDTFAEL